MANTEEELKNIFDSLLHINIYVVKILIHTWKKFKNIQLENLLSEMQEDMHLNLELGRKNFLLPLLMAFVTRLCHRGFGAPLSSFAERDRDGDQKDKV